MPWDQTLNTLFLQPIRLYENYRYLLHLLAFVAESFESPIVTRFVIPISLNLSGLPGRIPATLHDPKSLFFFADFTALSEQMIFLG